VSLQRVNTFSGLSLSLDRVAERRDDVAWIERQARSNDARYLVLDAAGLAYLRDDPASLRWLDHAERMRWLKEQPVTLLGLDAGRPVFLLQVEDTELAWALETGLGAKRAGLREVALNLPVHEAALFAYAKGLAHWQRETRHCAFCGSALSLVAAGHRAQCGNADCGRLHFPRTDAAIIAIVEHEGACLLGRQAGWPPGRYSTLAGFVEPGEALEDAVRREVAEESGVAVGEVYYHSSQPWPMPASLMVGFTAKALSRDIHLRDDELEDARWFTPEQIANGLRDGSFATPPPLSVSYQLLAHWLRSGFAIELDALIADSRH
jgi:NAD+ diphosphatase